MKVAIVYDRVNKWGGAERVLLALREIFPKAPLFTSVYDKKGAKWAKKFVKVNTSFIQKLPFSESKHEHFAFLMPIAFESFDFSEFDLVITVTSEAAKGIITKPETAHICYCLTPIRYLWSHHDFYFKNPPAIFSKIPLFYYLSRPFVYYMRKWDKIASQRPDHYIAISNEVKKRIKKYYKRDSEIIFPPVEIEKFTKDKKVKKGDYFLYVSRLIPYKRADLVVRAFNKMELPLVIIGTGSEEDKLKSIAKENIKFTGHLTDKELASYYQRARAFIFPQEEDFGIVALEAQAAGTPVIAYKKGGALDTVTEGKTGLFFNKQSEESLIKAVKKFEKIKFKRKDLIENAKRFSKENFQNNIIKFIENV